MQWLCRFWSGATTERIGTTPWCAGVVVVRLGCCQVTRSSPPAPIPSPTARTRWRSSEQRSRLPSCCRNAGLSSAGQTPHMIPSRCLSLRLPSSFRQQRRSARNPPVASREGPSRRHDHVSHSPYRPCNPYLLCGGRRYAGTCAQSVDLIWVWLQENPDDGAWEIFVAFGAGFIGKSPRPAPRR
jgi:hypothetical protein